MKIMKPVMPAPLIATALIISCFTGNIYAQEQARDQTRERIYGSQLMTQQERLEHRERMRTMQTNEQRETYRQEHHKKMQERAQERGVTIPDDPPPPCRHGTRRWWHGARWCKRWWRRQGTGSLKNANGLILHS